MRDVKDLFDLSIDEDYFKPIIVNGTFNNNYIQYENKGNKSKILIPSEYLDTIRPYLGDIINDHKIQGEFRIIPVIQYQTIKPKVNGKFN